MRVAPKDVRTLLLLTVDGIGGIFHRVPRDSRLLHSSC
jgi:hypothetical protein